MKKVLLIVFVAIGILAGCDKKQAEGSEYSKRWSIEWRDEDLSRIWKKSLE